MILWSVISLLCMSSILFIIIFVLPCVPFVKQKSFIRNQLVYLHENTHSFDLYFYFIFSLPKRVLQLGPYEHVYKLNL